MSACVAIHNTHKFISHWTWWQDRVIHSNNFTPKSVLLLNAMKYLYDHTFIHNYSNMCESQMHHNTKVENAVVILNELDTIMCALLSTAWTMLVCVILCEVSNTHTYSLLAR
jgi:hypothetical protein